MTALLPKIRVLDLSRILAGPWATQMLADFGADVIKIERPGVGDDVRQQGAVLNDAHGQPTGERSTFLSVNRGKRSVTIDMALPAGQALIRRLVADSDVLVENFKSGDLQRYGLDYASLQALNPRLVYCSITGFGQTGPYRHLPGYDLIFQSMSGLMSLTGVPDGEPGAGPQRAGYPVSDITAGLYATIGVLAALHHRDTVSGLGQHIDLALLDAQIAALSPMSMSYLVAGQLPQRVGLRSQLTCPYQDFDCADGQLMIAVGNDKQFAQLCQVIARPDLASDARFATTPQRVAHREILIPIIADLLKAQPLDHWMPRLREANVPSGPINNFEQVFEDPQVVHREVVQHITHPLSGTLPVVANPLKFSATPIAYLRPPPLLGEHTEQVLRERLGLDDAEISALVAQGVLTRAAR